MQIIVGILVIVLLLIFARRLIRLLLVLFSVFISSCIAFAAGALAAIVAMVVAELSGISEPGMVAGPLGILVFIVFFVHRLRRLGKWGDDGLRDASLPSVRVDQVSEPQREPESIIDGDAQLRADRDRALPLTFARRLSRRMSVLFSLFISGCVSLEHRLRRLGKRGDDAVLDASLLSVQADQVSEPQPEPESIIDGDAQLRAAWDRALHLAPRQRERVMASRRDCAALLAVADTETLDLSVRDLAAMVKRNVPPLVAKVDALGSGMATDIEREDLMKDLVEDLAQIGAAARRLVDAHQNTLRDDLAALRNHVKARTAERDL